MSVSTNNEVMELRQAIASRLKTARETAGLSQGQVAREMSLHRPTVSEIEAGRRKVSVEELTVFARIYDVSIDWLSCMESETLDPVENRLQLAARELASLKEEDLERLLQLLKTMRRGDVSAVNSQKGGAQS